MFERYAIFYTAASGSFADFGAAWLGWDSAAGQNVTQPVVPEMDIGRLTARPRKYGFHATLKAPFHLADDQTAEGLMAAVKQFAHDQVPVPLGALELSAAHGFIALRPVSAPVALKALAADVVTKFDVFRAPLSADGIARRRKSRLTPQQGQQMLDWGYPFVFEDFNFHMTLTGSLKRDEIASCLPQLETLIAPVLPTQLDVAAITLMGQDGEGMFHQMHRAALGG